MSRKWKMVKEQIQKEDGRYLVYYRFPEEESAERRKGYAEESPAQGVKARAAGGKGK